MDSQDAPPGESVAPPPGVDEDENDHESNDIGMGGSMGGRGGFRYA